MAGRFIPIRFHLASDPFFYISTEQNDIGIWPFSVLRNMAFKSNMHVSVPIMLLLHESNVCEHYLTPVVRGLNHNQKVLKVRLPFEQHPLISLVASISSVIGVTSDKR